jgi:hypothetical protein
MTSLADTPRPTPPTHGRARLQGAILFACCAALLAFGGYLDSPAEARAKHAAPDQRPTSLSSFGYPGCGFKRVTGLPCASCGMTTSYTYLADGRLTDAFLAQPAGALLGVGTAMLALIGAWSAMTAMPLGPVYRTIFRARHVVIAVGLILAAWVFNIVRTLGV